VYRELYPQADAALSNTIAVAARVIVLPTGTTLPEGTIETIAGVFAAI
jgi:dTDP-4-amino-4,6-dideoxygalactose transaminase